MKNMFTLNHLDNGLSLNCKWDKNVCDITLTNTSVHDQKLGDITFFKAPMPFAPDTEFYGEGYNMLSQYGGTINDFKLLGSYSDYDHYKFKRPEGINQVYNMLIFSPKDQNPLLIGYSSCNRFNGWIRFNEKEIQLAIDGEGILLKAGETISLEQIYVEQGERNTILNNFASAIEKNHPKREYKEIPTGWCSWLVYGPNITSKNIYDNLDAIKENNLDLKYIQIDDGYQAHWGDWFDFTDKFEGGVKKVCLDIKEKGFEPAIWVAPFVAEKDSKLFCQHPDWFIKDENGYPLSSGDVSFGGWRCGPWYILDTTHPDALNYIKTVFSTMHNEWKINYFKLDAIVWEAFPFGVRHDNTKTCIEAFKMGMNAIIEAVGDESFILGGNSPMWPAIGLVNGMRVTNDNQRYFDQFKQIAKECFHRNWQHNRLWINDPDTVLLQNQTYEIVGPDGSIITKGGNVLREEFLFNAVYTLACGGMVLSGDDIPVLTNENAEFLKKLIPPTNVACEFDDTSFTIGRAKISEDKEIICVFNFDDFKKDVRVSINGKMKVLDLFENEVLGTFENEISFKDFKPHYAKALICTRA